MSQNSDFLGRSIAVRGGLVALERLGVSSCYQLDSTEWLHEGNHTRITDLNAKEPGGADDPAVVGSLVCDA